MTAKSEAARRKWASYSPQERRQRIDSALQKRRWAAHVRRIEALAADLSREERETLAHLLAPWRWE